MGLSGNDSRGDASPAQHSCEEDSVRLVCLTGLSDSFDSLQLAPGRECLAAQRRFQRDSV